MPCPNLTETGCQIIERIAGAIAQPSAVACKYCTDTAQPPQAVNEVTVSLAITAARPGSPLSIQLVETYRPMLLKQPEPAVPVPLCRHRGAELQVIDGDQIGCGCGLIRIVACRVATDGLCLLRPIRPDVAESLHSLVPAYRSGRVCAGCHDAQAAGQAKPWMT